MHIGGCLEVIWGVGGAKPLPLQVTYKSMFLSILILIKKMTFIYSKLSVHVF